jgi:hypothetical protein
MYDAESVQILLLVSYNCRVLMMLSTLQGNEISNNISLFLDTDEVLLHGNIFQMLSQIG